MMWLPLTDDERTAVSELSELPDRAAAITGATLIEFRLRERLRKATTDLKIKDNNTLHGRMFGSSGPLGSFSSQINLGFMIQLYGEQVWRDLHIIRGIRNDFAHLTAARSFEDASVRDRCRNLVACDMHFEESNADNPRGHSMVSGTDGIKIYMPDLATKLPIARHRYLLSVMYYAAFLSIVILSEDNGTPKHGVECYR